MRVLLIEPYYGGSHRAWADGYQRHSWHDVTLLTLPAQFWKWRMQGGAVSLTRMIAEQDHKPDVFFVSEMIDLANFRALLPRHLQNIPIALYCHENQLTYPQNSRQKHGWRYGFINYISALAADAVYFNSPYHHQIFLATLPNLLKHFGDYNELQTVEMIRAKSHVLPLGLDLTRFDAYRPPIDQPNTLPLIVWNHRWEDDKNPEGFFRALRGLVKRDIPFQVAITGENFQKIPESFIAIRDFLGERVTQFGYMTHFADYARLLWQADYVVSTAHQEFFGGAIAEAITCGCVPILPDRLNYPYLIPQDYHKHCLYPGESLLYKLIDHLSGRIAPVETHPLQAHIAAHDWAHMASRYDEALSSLASSTGV